jgi:hypothetical protein
VIITSTPGCSYLLGSRCGSAKDIWENKQESYEPGFASQQVGAIFLNETGFKYVPCNKIDKLTFYNSPMNVYMYENTKIRAQIRQMCDDTIEISKSSEFDGCLTIAFQIQLHPVQLFSPRQQDFNFRRSIKYSGCHYILLKFWRCETLF